MSRWFNKKIAKEMASLAGVMSIGVLGLAVIMGLAHLAEQALPTWGPVGVFVLVLALVCYIGAFFTVKLMGK